MTENAHIRMPTELRLRAVAELLKYARNARTHSDEQVEQIMASILQFGFTNPVLTAGDRILAGHGRIEALERLHVAHVPTIDLSHLSDEEQRLLILADNKLALNAGWDDNMLKVELSALRDLDLDLSLTGFSEDELDALLKDVEPPPDDLPEPPDGVQGTQGCELVRGPNFVTVTARMDGQVLAAIAVDGLTEEQSRLVHQLAELLAASRGDPAMFEENVEHALELYA